ncbi:Anillin [Pseudolycoriella hygida]|uniref:Anillin n=1 Tax=Pseudolycoriella hygida TaxID=35572 RepID=A0A9Q0NFN9_9DIPT|nr:Anillin [Pseudolycoriella hygida]
MDSFTQRMLELAEQRSKALGMTSTNKFPLAEYNQEESANSSPKKSSSPTKSYTVVHKDSNSMVKCTPQRKSSAESKENVDVALEINITTGPNVQVQVEVEEREIDEHGNICNSTDNASNERTPMIRDSSRNRLQRLGALYSEPENLSSPIHRNEARFDDETQSEGVRGKPSTRIGKLAALASQINDWEDQSSVFDGKHTKQSTPTSPIKNLPTVVATSPRKIVGTGAIPKQTTKSIASLSEETAEKSSSKNLKWDKNVMDHLEQQGFQRRESTTSKLVYDYKEQKPIPDKDKTRTVTETGKKTYISTAHISKISEVKSRLDDNSKVASVKTTPVVAKGLVSDRAARFESSQQIAALKNQKDPAEMSLKERLALFEKNKGTALIPKAALGMSVSAKQIMNEGQSPKPNSPEKPKVTSFNKPIFAESTASGSGIRNTVAALMSNAKTLSQTEISNEVRKQREKEMNVVLGRFNRNIDSPPTSDLGPKTQNIVKPISPPPAPPMPGMLWNKDRTDGKSHIKRKSNEKLPQPSNNRRLSEEDSKRVKVNPTKNARLYPVLSDIESQTTESERDDCTTATVSEGHQHNQSYSEEDSYMDSGEEDDICDMSLGREIMQAVKRNDPLRPETRNTYISSNNYNTRDSSTASEYSGNYQGDDIDDYINEALDEEDDSYQENVTPQRKGSISSNSFSYARSPSKSIRHQTIVEDDSQDGTRQVNFKCPVKSEITVNPSEDNNVVTLTHTVSFYRRQQSQNTPAKKLAYSDDDEESSEASDAPVTDHLFDERLKQLLNEIHKQEQIIKQTSQALNYCAQTFEFSGSAESVESERHLLLATKTRKALLDEMTRLKVDRCIRPPNAVKECGSVTVRDITIPLKEDYITKLDMDVCNGHHLVCLLTYNDQVLATKTVTTRKGLKAVKFQDEFRLNNVYADFTLFLEIYGMTAQREVLPHDIKYHITKTPKGKKRQQQPLPSPGGPFTVRTSALTHYGSVTFSIKEVNRSSWSLNQESFVSPLLGKIFMKVNCELSVVLQHKGFLTMFEDVSGFGAWHRRWCCLQGSILNYWRYPDDEKAKPPMGSIDLQSCISNKIEPVRRDVCARLHTVLIELRRPCHKDDKNSLVLEKHSNYTIVRHLLSADTKEDRDIWCTHFNKSLVLIRSWNATKKD